MLSKRYSQLIRLFAIISLSYFLASCGDGDGPTPVAAEPCPADGIVSFDSNSYPSSATAALISVTDTCIGRKAVVVNVNNGTDTIGIDLAIVDGEGSSTLKFGVTNDQGNTIAINEGDVLTVTYADANGVTRSDTADITASTALSTLGVYSETNINPKLDVAELINKDTLTDRFSQTVSALEGDYSLKADYVLPSSGNSNGLAFTFFGLNNPTFEAEDASGGNIEGAVGWTTFEFAYTNNTAGPGFGPVSHDAGGSQSLTMFGPFTFDSASGAYQPDNNVVPGQSYTATAHVMNWAPDPLAANNIGIMQLTFWDDAGGQVGGGAQIGPAYELLVDSTDDGTNIYLPPQDGAEISDWTELQITQTAPAGAVSAEIFLLHIQLNPASDPAAQAGSIFWDDVSLAGVKDLSRTGTGKDISTYETLKFGINTTAASGLMDLEIKMEDNAGATASVFLSDYTSLVVGDWSLLEIPLSDFTGIDKTRMIVLGFYNASSTVTGSTAVPPTLLAATLYFDDVHFSRASDSGPVSGATTTIDASLASVVADGLTSSTITVQAKDSSGNNITVSAGVVLLSTTGSATLSAVTDNNDGTYTATLTNTVAEAVIITGTIAGDAIADNAIVTFTPGSALETLGVYSETNVPVLDSVIINSADFSGNSTVTDENSTAVAPLDGAVSLEADFQDGGKTYGGVIFDFTTTTGGGTNLLTNQSFELPDATAADQGGCAGGDLGGWSYFNCNYISNNTRNNTPPGAFYSPGAHDGSQLLKQFGGDAGVFQTVAASPGETINVSAHAMSWSGDAFNNVGLLQIFFLDAGGNNISGGFTPFAQVVAAAPAVGGTPDYVLAPQDGADLTDWTLMEISAVAPAGAVEVKVQMIHILEASTPNGGALWWDDVSLSKDGSVVSGVDISTYESLKFGIDTSGIATFAELKVQLEDGTVTPGVFLSAYTPTVSSNWEIYEIPLSDFTGLDKSNLTLMGLWNASSVAGAESPLVFGPLYFDDIHFIKGIPTVPVLTGVLLDSPVEGVTFSTATQSGVTNVLGEFQYQAGEIVTFSVGDIILGVVEGAAIITPVELTGSFDPTSQAAINLLVFLQSIDQDQNHSNGITISAVTQAAAVGQTLDFNLSSSAFTAAVTSVVGVIAPGNTVVSETTALDNFYLTYVDLGGTNTFSWLFPGYPQVGEPGYDLIWSDEFNVGASPSAVNWTMETGYGDFGWGNNEWQLYTTSPDNVRVESGNLVITADCPTAPTCGVRDGSITSARINTLNKFSFKYGKIKARLKPPVGESAWPAFWMLGANFPDVGWPNSGEIDVMEMHNAFSDEFTTHFTMHYCDDYVSSSPCLYDPGWTYDSQYMTFGESLGNDFHIFEAEWESGQMIGKIDGITYFTKTIDPANMDEFLKEFFVILNVAMGGTLGSNNLPPTGSETWPQTMLVDYVRVYQLTGGDGTYTIGGGGTPGPNLLTNQSFELPDATAADQGGCAGGDLGGWSYFNCNYISNNTRNNTPPGAFYSPGAHEGSQLLKQYGGDAGIFQTVAAAPGETVNASAYAMSWSGDVFNNVGLLQIFFYDAAGDNITDPDPNGYVPAAQVVAAAPAVGGTPNYVLSPQDGGELTDWTLMEVSAVAPAGTVEAKIQMIHILEGSTPNGGALWWDDASLTVTGSVATSVGVYSETNTSPALPYVQIIDAGVDFGGNSTAPNEFSTAVTPLDGDFVLQALFLNSAQTYGGIIFNFGSAVFPPNPGAGDGQDISAYTTLKFGIDTSGIATFADIKIQLEDGVAKPGVFLSAYTPTVSGNWKVYEIPLNDFAGLNKANLTYLGFWNASSVAGAEAPLVFGPLYFDDIHFTDAGGTGN